jgi:hypothetical protein
MHTIVHYARREYTKEYTMKKAKQILNVVIIVSQKFLNQFWINERSSLRKNRKKDCTEIYNRLH